MDIDDIHVTSHVWIYEPISIDISTASIQSDMCLCGNTPFTTYLLDGTSCPAVFEPTDTKKRGKNRFQFGHEGNGHLTMQAENMQENRREVEGLFSCTA